VNDKIRQIMAKHQEAMYRELALIGGNRFRKEMTRLANIVGRK
jgi:hypothetical protein